MALRRADAATGLRSAGGAASLASVSGLHASWAGYSWMPAYTSSSPSAPSSPYPVGAAAAATARRPGSVCSRGVIGEGEEPSRPRDPADGPIRPMPPRKGPTPSRSATSRRQEGRRAAGGDGGGGCRAAGGDAEVRRTDGTLARGDRQRERLEPLVRQREREEPADAEGLRGAVDAAARNPPAERLEWAYQTAGLGFSPVAAGSSRNCTSRT